MDVDAHAAAAAAAAAFPGIGDTGSHGHNAHDLLPQFNDSILDPSLLNQHEPPTDGMETGADSAGTDLIDEQPQHQPGHDHQVGRNSVHGYHENFLQHKDFEEQKYIAIPQHMTDSLMTDPFQLLRFHTLPVLENLSSQVLNTLGGPSHQHSLKLLTHLDSDQSQAYFALITLFNQCKRAYSSEAFLDADAFNFRDDTQRTTIRKSNLATFLSSIFGSTEVGFYHLNENFLSTFVPEGGRLLKTQGALFLDLKTQAYISAMTQKDKAQEQILDELFPSNMEDVLMARRLGAKQLTPTEVDFCGRCKSRREYLAKCKGDDDLAERYYWPTFLREIAEYISKNKEVIVSIPSRKRNMRKPQVLPNVDGGGPGSNSFNDGNIGDMSSPENDGEDQDLSLSEHGGMTHEVDSADAMQLDAALFADHNFSLDGTIDPNQSTAELYEEARMAATRGTSSSRKSLTPVQRRPWTKEEEQALLNGLDAVKGPHWSQILSMYGPGGTVSEILKDRNQVQLKDKARNLKLFFLKSHLDVPYYLKVCCGLPRKLI